MKFQNIKVHEPSDVCSAPGNSNLFMVSDDGNLFETDGQGKIIRKASFEGIDFEAVHVNETTVFVVDETLRKIRVFDRQTLSLVKTINVPYSGGRNKGFESITYNESKKCFVLVTESDPIYIIEYNEAFQQINELRFEGAKDISSARWHNNKLWLLSDEEMTVFQLNPENYSVEKSYKIPVLNPEGLCFNGNNEMLITSDDLEKLYFFKAP